MRTINYMSIIKTILFTISLFLGINRFVRASDNQDDVGCSAPKRLDRDQLRYESESDDSPECTLNTLPDELGAMIISSLPRKNQVSLRRVSRKIKEIVENYAWQNQSCTLRGERLSLGINAIKSLPFRSLTLRFKKWESEDIQALALLTGLTTLNVDFNKIGDVGAEALSKLTGLTSLHTYDTQIRARGAEAFSALTGLTTLNISYNQIGDVGAEALSKQTSLTTLNVSSNQISDDGAVALSKMTGLAILNLHSNQISDVGAGALSKMTGLKSLGLTHNAIGEGGRRELEELSNQGVKVYY